MVVSNDGEMPYVLELKEGCGFYHGSKDGAEWEHAIASWIEPEMVIGLASTPMDQWVRDLNEVI